MVSHLVFVPVGHGGPDSGAVGKDGTRESAIALAVSLKLKSFLEGLGYRVILSRSTDVACDSLKSAAMCEIYGAELSVSLHCNDYPPNPTAHGMEVWSSVGQDESDRLVTLLYQLAPMLLPGIKLRRGDETDDPGKEKDWNVVRRDLVGCPAVLVEMGFMSNVADRDCLKTESYQNRMAFLIGAAVHAWFAVSY